MSWSGHDFAPRSNEGCDVLRERCGIRAIRHSSVHLTTEAREERGEFFGIRNIPLPPVPCLVCPFLDFALLSLRQRLAVSGSSRFVLEDKDLDFFFRRREDRLRPETVKERTHIILCRKQNNLIL